jgi:hypothetical protein
VVCPLEIVLEILMVRSGEVLCLGGPYVGRRPSVRATLPDDGDWLGGHLALVQLGSILSQRAGPTVCGWKGVRWEDVALASGATLAGCIVGSIIPSLPEGVLRGITACVLAS